MTSSAYYNEIDPYAAAWLRSLIAAGHIAPGEVDERSIADVRPDDLLGYVQCHFFAGVGVWSYALRRAGWPDDLPVWTGSCPCQPFSAAGRGEGFADERHLWPAFHHLIAQRQPAVVFGEQVASKAVDPWIDLFQDDMEGLGYAFGAVPFPSAGVGAPHIHDRAYFVAHANGGLLGSAGHIQPSGQHGFQSQDGSALREGGARAWSRAAGGLAAGELADAGSSGFRRGRELGQDAGAACPLPEEVREQRLRVDLRADGTDGFVDDAIGSRLEGQRSGHSTAIGHGEGSVRPVAETGEPVGLADAALGGRGEERPHAGGLSVGDRTEGLPAGSFAGGGNQRPGPTNGFWRDPDWLHCRDGRWRPVEPGTFPLAHGAPARVGRLRAYGNAINAEAAAAFIAAARDLVGVA